MSLQTPDLFDGIRDKVQIAIDRFRFFEREALTMSPLGYYLAFSGGKDSIVMQARAQRNRRWQAKGNEAHFIEVLLRERAAAQETTEAHRFFVVRERFNETTKGAV